MAIRQIRQSFPRQSFSLYGSYPYILLLLSIQSKTNGLTNGEPVINIALYLAFR